MYRAAPCLAAALLPACAAFAQGFPFTDTFDSYTTGPFPCATPGCVGPGGWGLWHYAYTGGPQPGSIITTAAHTGTKAFKLSRFTDVIRSGNITSGQWVIKAQTFFPSNLTAPTDSGYFILLNECNTTPPVSFSLLLLFEGASGQIKNTLLPDAGFIPIARGQWTELRIDVDLDTHTHSVFYGGQALYQNRPYAPSGRMAVECLALYSDGIDGMLFDTISVQPAVIQPPPPPPCYANCDGSTRAPVLRGRDFMCFVRKFHAGDTYANCDGSTGTPMLTVGDLLCFIREFHRGCD
jgi:hypothetical protein